MANETHEFKHDPKLLLRFCEKNLAFIDEVVSGVSCYSDYSEVPKEIRRLLSKESFESLRDSRTVGTVIDNIFAYLSKAVQTSIRSQNEKEKDR